MLLPGASVLARLVAAARDRASDRLYATLADALTAGQRERLRALLDVVPGEAVSGLERLRAGPRKLTATELLDALLRLRDVRDVGVGQITVDVPAGRERALARYGLVAKAQALRRMSAKRRDATLLAALWQLELDAADDALILLDQVVDQLLSQAAREHKAARFKQLPELDRAARRLRAAVLVLLDPPPGGSTRCGRRSAPASAATSFTPPATRSGASRHPSSTQAARTPRFARSCCAATRACAASCPRCLRSCRSRRPAPASRSSTRLTRCAPSKGRPGRVSAASVPLQLVGGQWKRLVLANPQLGDDELDRRAYSFCVLEALQRALDRRDVFVARSGRFTRPAREAAQRPGVGDRQARDLREPQPRARPRARPRSPRRRARRRLPPDRRAPGRQRRAGDQAHQRHGPARPQRAGAPRRTGRAQRAARRRRRAAARSRRVLGDPARGLPLDELRRRVHAPQRRPRPRRGPARQRLRRPARRGLQHQPRRRRASRRSRADVRAAVVGQPELRARRDDRGRQRAAAQGPRAASRSSRRSATGTSRPSTGCASASPSARSTPDPTRATSTPAAASHG